MSTAKILSVAARKAALEAKKVGAQAMVFALFLILGVGAVFSFSGRNTAQISAAPEQTPTSTSAPATAPSQSSAPAETKNQPGGKSVQIRTKGPIPIKTASPNAETEILAEAFTAANLAAVQNSQIINSQYLVSDNRQTLVVAGEALSANFEFQTLNESVSSLMLKFDVEDEVYKSFPYTYKTVQAAPGKLTVQGQLGYFVDRQGRIVKNNSLQAAEFEMTLLVDSQGLVYSAEIQLKNNH
jgi:RNA polymerase sigma-70 factor (ECF subfamily)